MLTRMRLDAATRLIALAATAGLLLGAAGCGDRDSKPLAAAAQSALAYFPADSTMAGGMKPAALQSSGLYKAIWPLASKLGGATELMQQAQQACGMNPLERVKDIHFGGGKETIILIKGLDRGAARKCFEAMGTQQGRKVSVTADGAYEQYTGDRRTQWVRWIDDTTALAASDKATLETRAAGVEGLDKSTGFLEMAGKIDTSAELWFVTRDVQLPRLPIKLDLDLEAAFLSIGVSHGLEIKGGVRLATDAAAKEAVGRFNSYLDSMKASVVGSMASGVTIKQSGPDVLIHVQMDTRQVDQIVALLPMMMAMMKSQLGSMGIDLGGGGSAPPPPAPPPAEAPSAPSPTDPAAPAAPGSAVPAAPASGGKAEGDSPAPSGTP